MTFIDPLVVALGDPAGVGPEIVAKAWMACHGAENCPPIVAVGDPRSIEAVWDGPIARISDPSEAARAYRTALPILGVEDAGEIRPGHPDFEGARCSLDSLELAVGLARSGAVGALVTGPVSKSQLYSVGFTHPGQTEFVAERCGIARENVVMMLAGPDLKVVPITTHMPLAAVPAALTIDLIVSRSIVTARGLQRNFGIENPRLAFAGLNPHAGETGMLGQEEIAVIAPAIEILRSEGIDAVGPVASDGMFHPRARAEYDVAMCMYHDQALIPIKTLNFDDGVNMSLGLPIVRTSPDHGTAFGIAGTDSAHPGAMIAAIRMAAAAARTRLDRALA